MRSINLGACSSERRQKLVYVQLQTILPSENFLDKSFASFVILPLSLCIPTAGASHFASKNIDLDFLTMLEFQFFIFF